MQAAHDAWRRPTPSARVNVRAMDDFRTDGEFPRPGSGVEGLGFAGRDDGVSSPTVSDEGVPGLGFGGQARPDEFDADRYVVTPDVDADDEDEIDVDEPEDATD
jgi:hypothetical protein